MKVAIVGCGYVAALYAQTFVNHPELELVGAYDKMAERTKGFCEFFKTRPFQSLDALLAESGAEIIANLTNPREHYAITKACLEAGRHVYSEKPLGMTASEARELVSLAQSRGLSLSAAPCNMLSEAVQTMWKVVRDGSLGRIRLIYAEMDDGMVPLEDYQSWRTINQTQWPAKDEFEIGCTYEHAGYHLGILAQIFGPARRISSYSSSLIPEKGAHLGCKITTPDFSVGCLEYDDGVTARLTCSIVAPLDRSLTIIGEKARITLDDVWNYGGKLTIQDTVKHWEPPKRDLVSRVKRRLGIEKPKVEVPKIVPLVREANFAKPVRANPMDFCRGIAEQSASIRAGRPSRLSAELAVHITELTEALQHPAQTQPTKVQSTFAPITPMPWAGTF
ncbi:MAG: Gfo/Idh/MocA family oxidoreductase [Alphaproteobacteria bacterium]